jgi:hypothetical protein
LEIWARETIEFCERSLLGNSGGSLEGQKNRISDSEYQAHEVLDGW